MRDFVMVIPFMRIMGIGLLCVMSAGNGFADDMAMYQDGKIVASELQEAATPLDNEKELTSFSDYRGQDTSVPESKLTHSELKEEATRETYRSRSDVGSTLVDSERTVLDNDYRITKDDHLIQDSNTVVKNPLAVIGGKVSTTKKPTQLHKTTHTCEESGVHSKHVCLRERELKPPHKTTKTMDIKFWYQATDPNIHLELNILTDTQIIGAWWGRGGDPRARDISAGVDTPFPKDKIPHIKKITLISAPSPLFDFVRISLSDNGIFRIDYKEWRDHYDQLTQSRINAVAQVEYEDFTFEDDPHTDEIVDQCTAFEAMTDKGLCRYGDSHIIEGAGSRTIKVGTDEVKVHRDWWKREYTYYCKPPSQNNCDPFRKQGCEQVKSVCIKREGGLCVNNQKTFVCESKTRGYDVDGFTGDIPFCLDGNCDDHSWSDNKDFADAMTKLSIFKEMQDDMDAKKATIFKGTEHQCNKDVIGFQDCCQGGGWGNGIGLARACSSAEVDLRELKDKKKCVYIGTYCAEKLLGICLRKKQSYCCFGSKLSRIIHEQGRKQLGVGWGDVRRPNCRPFTVDEVTAIDFSQIDLSELFEDLLSKTNLESMTASAKQMSTKWNDKIQAASPVREEARQKADAEITKRYFGVEGKDASL